MNEEIGTPGLFLFKCWFCDGEGVELYDEGPGHGPAKCCYFHLCPICKGRKFVTAQFAEALTCVKWLQDHKFDAAANLLLPYIKEREDRTWERFKEL